MDKIVAILGIIVLLTLGTLFFCAGFLSGTKVTLQNTSNFVGKNPDALSASELKNIIDPSSASLSEKILGLISSATDKAGDAISSATGPADNKVSVDFLLREMASHHDAEDECSHEKTVEIVAKAKNEKYNSMAGKKIVFVGCFKNNVALEIQKLLIGKGYKAHLEISKQSDGTESFIFCGPFKKNITAKRLVDWLASHGFKEARSVNVARGSIEKTVYELEDDEANLPDNDEDEANSDISDVEKTLRQHQLLAQTQQNLLKQQEIVRKQNAEVQQKMPSQLPLIQLPQQQIPNTVAPSLPQQNIMQQQGIVQQQRIVPQQQRIALPQQQAQLRQRPPVHQDAQKRAVELHRSLQQKGGNIMPVMGQPINRI